MNTWRQILKNKKSAKLCFTFTENLHCLLCQMSAEPPTKVIKMSSTVQDSAKTTPTKRTIDELKAVVQQKIEVDYQFNEISEDGTELCVKLLSDHAILPVRASRNAAGFDLFSAEDKVIGAQCHDMVKTDIAIMLPKGTYGRVAPRSGLAKKKFIDVGAGVIDYDYRGNVGIIIFNHFKEEFVIKKGDRIAQLIIEKISMPILVNVKELNETERGDGAYGSTDKPVNR